MRRAWRAARWLALLGAALVGLRLAATGELAPPPLTSLDALEAWIELRGPVTTALALVRFASELAAWYLLALSSLHLLAGAARSDGIHILADAVSVGASKRVVHAALGLGVIATATPPGDEPAAPPATVAGARADEVAERHAETGTASMRPVGEHAGAGTAWMTPSPDHDVEADVLARPSPPATWRVEQGDSFWSIASEVLEAAWQRSPADREVDPFWRALVAANRDRLVAHDDPDLVVPGQVFEVPPVPPPA